MTHPKTVNDLLDDFLSRARTATPSDEPLSPTLWGQALRFLGDWHSRPEMGKGDDDDRQVASVASFTLVRDEALEEERGAYAEILANRDRLFEVLEGGEPERWEDRPRRYPWLPPCVLSFFDRNFFVPRVYLHHLRRFSQRRL
jgi:hypothetical protein